MNLPICVKNISKNVVQAIKELRALGFFHGDIQLPNVCFNAEYQAVLIDFDRANKYLSVCMMDWTNFSRILKLSPV